ncbi:MAG: hypothetical protein IPJ01_11795 [Micavibrio sp.]|nr:hypothetical protein [Micavibrio sp.]
MEFDKNIIGYDLKNKWFLKLEYIELSKSLGSLDGIELNKLIDSKIKVYFNKKDISSNLIKKLSLTEGKSYQVKEITKNSASRISYVSIINDEGVIELYSSDYFLVKEIGKHKHHLIKNKIYISDKLRFNEYGEFSVSLGD